MISTDNWLVWTARKLASQPPSYLPLRLLATARKLWIAKVFPTAAMLRSATLTPPDNAGQFDIRKNFCVRATPRWHWDIEDVSRIADSIPDERRRRTVRQAELVLEREFTFRGMKPIRLSNGQWAPGGVSVGWIWDLNRHHWFTTLGFAYCYTGDVRFLQAFVDRSSDWMEQFLHKIGRIEWDTPFEIASRINAWLWTYFLFVTAEAWPSTHHDSFLNGLGRMAEYLSHSLEYHCPGNHIMLEAKSLAIVGEVFPEFVGSRVWRRKGWRTLRCELDRQIGSDGVHAERSTMYHRIVAGELAELWYFCRRNQIESAPLIGATVEKMAEFQAWIDQGGGQQPLLGDAHVGDTYYRFCAPAMANVGAKNASRLVDSESTEHTLWLLAAQNGGTSQAFGTAMPGGRAFPDGGYFVARSNWSMDADVLTWDCGPAGFDLNRKHAHLDTLAFTLSCAGTPILIDPGTHEDRARSPSLRSTGVHNTIQIDGEDQGILARRDEIWSPPRARLLLWASSNECTVMAGSHDGYRRLRDPVDVMRAILVMHGSYLIVLDAIRGPGLHRIEQRFHLAPGSKIDKNVDHLQVRITNGRANLNMRWAGAPADRLESDRATTPRLKITTSVAELLCGRPEVTTMICAEMTEHLPADLALVATSRLDPLDIRWVRGAGASQWMTVTDETFEHSIYFDVATRTPAPLPGVWQTDAWLAVIRRNPNSADSDVLIPSWSKAWRSDGKDCEKSSLQGDFRVINLAEKNY